MFKDAKTWLVDGVKKLVSNLSGSSVIASIATAITGSKSKTSTSGVTKFASGGVIKTPTLGYLGEYVGARNNPEIVAPQNILEATVYAGNSELINAFAQMTQQVIRAIENNETTIQIGDETIAKSASRGNKSYQKRTGMALI